MGEVKQVGIFKEWCMGEALFPKSVIGWEKKERAKLLHGSSKLLMWQITCLGADIIKLMRQVRSDVLPEGAIGIGL